MAGMLKLWNGSEWIYIAAGPKGDRGDPGMAVDATYKIDQAGGTSPTYGAITGDRNGINTDFFCSQGLYVSGTMSIWKNGQLLTQSTGSEGWWELDPAVGSIHFATPPISTDIITFAYGFMGMVDGPRGEVGPIGPEGPEGPIGNNAPIPIHHQQIIWSIEGPFLYNTQVFKLKFDLAYVGASAAIEEIHIRLDVAPVSTALRFRVLKNGTSIFTGTNYIEVPTGQYTASRTTGFVDDGAIAKDDYFQLEIVQGDGFASDMVAEMRYKWTMTGE